jgi:hypothetical protein
LAFYFTNQDLLQSQRIDEKVEHPTVVSLGNEPKDSDFNFYRLALVPQNSSNKEAWWYALNSFRVFEGKEKKIKTKKDLEHMQQAHSITQI